MGRTVRGRSREDEHREVLAELATLARDREVDLVLVAGDLFDTAAPSPQAEEIVYRALLDLAATGAQVVVIAGNHDNPRRLSAVRPLLQLANVHTSTEVVAPDAGGVLELKLRSGETAQVALLPWLSQRRLVTAAELMTGSAAEHIGLYTTYYRDILAALCAGFSSKTVNIVLSHVSVLDAGLGGGEREAQATFDYCVPAQVFPEAAHYVALGHFHRPQSCPAATKVWYSGSPLQLDFGEGQDEKCALIVDAAPGVPAVVEQVRLQSGKALKTLLGPLASVLDQAKHYPDAYLRLILDEAPRAGLSDEVRELIPNAVDIRVAAPERDPKRAAGVDTTGLSATDLFARYLEERGMNDDRLQKLFHDLWEEALAADTA